MSINDLAIRGPGPSVFNSNEPIKANWRPKAIVPHAAVVQTVMLNPREFDERSNRNPKMLDYPIASKEDMSVLKGEFAFEVVPPKLRINLTTHSDVYVFTSASGMCAKETMGRIRFVGQVAKGTDAQGDRDNAVSVQVAGPVTTVNAGREYIFAGNTVIAEWPEYLIKGGKKVPGVDVMGTPGTKFLFNIRPLRFNDVFTAFIEIRKAAMAELFKDASERRVSHDQRFNRIKHLAEPYSHWRHVPDDSQCPVYRYLHLICDMCIDNEDVWRPETWCMCGTSEAAVAHANAMNGLLGKRKFEHRADSLSADAVKRLRRSMTTHDGGPPIRSAKDIFDEETAGVDPSLLPLVVKMMMMDAAQGLMMEQFNLTKRLVIGKALTTAGPGQPLDILMGSTH